MPSDHASAIAAVTNVAGGFAPLFAADRTLQARAYGPGKWTLRQILLHVTDCQMVFFDRLARLAAEESPLVLAFDENRWAARLGYAERDLAIAGRLYGATAAAIVDLVGALPAESWTRRGVHSQAGLVSFAEVLAKVATHAAHHLEQARAIAAGRTWPASA